MVHLKKTNIKLDIHTLANWFWFCPLSGCIALTCYVERSTGRKFKSNLAGVNNNI